MPQITQLDNDPTPNSNDLLVTVDMAAGTTKNISRQQFFTGAPLPANTVNGQAIADGSVTTGKLGFSIAYTGGSLSTGSNTVSFTPPYSGLLKVEARGRRNAGSEADTTIAISGVSGTTDGFTSPGVGRGSTDGFVAASYIGAVTAGTPVTLTITATNVNSNATYLFYVIPGNTIRLT